MSTLGSIASVFLLLFVGALLKKLKALKSEDTLVINSLIIYATVPALAFGILYGQRLTLQLLVIVVAGNVANLVALAVARGVGGMLRLSRPQLGAFMMAATFGNTTFMGIPVVEAAFGGNRQALLVAMVYSELAMSLPVYTLGMWLAARYGGGQASLKEIISPGRLPALPAMAAGVILTPFVLPQALQVSLERLGACTLPLAMISVGLMLSKRSFAGNQAPIAAAAALKLLCMPVIMYGILTLCQVTGLPRQTVVLQGGMPVSIIAGVMAARGGSDGPFVASVTLVTTLASMATLPLILTLIQ